MSNLGIVVQPFLYLWKKRRRLLAVLFLAAVAAILAFWYWNDIRVHAGRFGLWLADFTHVLSEDDPLAALNHKVRIAQARLKASTSSQDQQFYRQQITELESKREILLKEQTERAQSAARQAATTPGTPPLTYSSLERRPAESGVTFRVIALGDHLFSVEWQFTSYLIKNKEAKVGSPTVHETSSVSDIFDTGHAFYLGGIVLHKTTAGTFWPSSLNFVLFRLARPNWLAAKIVLETDDVFVGTIFSGLAPNAMEGLLVMLGLNLTMFPLSLEDPSFSPVSVKDLTEKYGLISLRGLLAPIFSPLILAKFTPGNLDIPIGGKKISEYEVMAFRAVGPRLVAPLGLAAKKS